MKLIRLELINFGPYRGHQVMDLDVSSEAPVILVHGENMRGKTTILRGLRWALYGEVKGHDGVAIPAEDFANYEVRDLGDDFEFGVKLVFEDQGSVNELTRMCTAIVDRDLFTPSVKVAKTNVSLRPLTGNPVPERMIPESVARTLHSDIADFFLFDGEMLTRFEESLRSDSTRAQVVKTSIERVLGLPALQLTKRDAASLLHDADVVMRKATTRRREADKFEKEYVGAEAELNRLRDDVDNLREHRVDVALEVKSLGDELAKVDSVKEMYFRRAAMETEVTVLKQDLQDLEGDLKSRVAECWWIPLAGAIQGRIAALETEIATGISTARERDNLLFEIRQLQSQPDAHTCPMCRQPLNTSLEQDLLARQRTLQIQLDSLNGAQSDLGSLHAERKQLTKYASADITAERIADIETDMSRVRIRIADKEEQIAEMNDALRGTRLDIAAVEATYQEQRLLLRDIDAAIKSAEEDEGKLGARLRQLSQDIAKLAGGHTPERLERDVLDALVDAVDGAIDNFREGMRAQVEEEASAIFRRLSTESTYSGLRIDGRYYLEIVDGDDKVIRRRSAGADQIVTMSLIGALVRCAVRQGPVVMDTPFGRLDRGHRERILRWVPTLGTQVVLFVQSGEFDRERDLAFLDGMIGREYTLRRASATHTQIEAYSA